MFLAYAILILLPALTSAQVTIRPPNELSLELFHDVDRNSDGHVTRAEIDIYYLDYDVNNDGRITPIEFSQYINRHHPDLSTYDHQLYAFFDFNNDKILNHADFDNLFTQIDSSGNGICSQAEFVKYFNVIFGSIGK